MIKSADVVFPRVKYRKHVKPFWNSTLKDLRKAFMAARLEWIRKGSQGSQRIFITCNTKKLNANTGCLKKKATT
jgi:hypothetical protein